jgi:S-DNA-T family DNA segregation ATPase FtsK/SpoIIIE
MGADKLLGNGDMLFLWPGTSTLLRGQGTYVHDDEISRVIAAVATSEPQFVKELVQLKTPAQDGDAKQLNNRDELYESAIDIVVREGRGSVSLLQRSLGIGYGRAARLIDFMAEDGIVGPYNGSQAREILLTLAQWEEMGHGAAGGPAAPAAEAAEPRRSSKILMAPDEQRMPSGAVRTVKAVDDADDTEEEETDSYGEDDEPPFDEDSPGDEERKDDWEEDQADEAEEDGEEESDDGGQAEEEDETQDADEPRSKPGRNRRTGRAGGPRGSPTPRPRRWNAESA